MTRSPLGTIFCVDVHREGAIYFISHVTDGSWRQSGILASYQLKDRICFVCQCVWERMHGLRSICAIYQGDAGYIPVQLKDTRVNYIMSKFESWNIITVSYHVNVAAEVRIVLLSKPNLYSGADPGFLKRRGGGTWGLQAKEGGGSRRGPTLGPMLKSLQRGPKGGPPGSAHVK